MKTHSNKRPANGSNCCNCVYNSTSMSSWEFFGICFATFASALDALLASFVYINRRHGERGQVKAERKSPRRLSCRLSRLPPGSPQKFMPHRSERSSPQTQLARTGRLDLTHWRAASSTLPPCWQPDGLRASQRHKVCQFVSSEVRSREAKRRRWTERTFVCLLLFLPRYFTLMIFAILEST